MAAMIPQMVATVGLHGSASTWVFNVVRELMIASVGEAHVAAIYAEQPEELPDLGGRHLVLKSHHGGAGLDAWLEAARPLVLLSVRDPRDAALSMARRFGAPLEHAAGWLAADCARMARLAPQGHMLLRYEDRFFDDRACLARIARALGADPAPAAAEAIFVRYSTEGVRRFTRTIAGLPPDRVLADRPVMLDRVTQIHATHVGDARSGKWRELPGPAQAELTCVFLPFLEAFGYAD